MDRLETIAEMIEAIESGDRIVAQQHFQSLMSEKVSETIADERRIVAESYYNKDDDDEALDEEDEDENEDDVVEEDDIEDADDEEELADDF